VGDDRGVVVHEVEDQVQGVELGGLGVLDAAVGGAAGATARLTSS
jgi:hypothetical protein